MFSLSTGTVPWYQAEDKSPRRVARAPDLCHKYILYLYLYLYFRINESAIRGRASRERGGSLGGSIDDVKATSNRTGPGAAAPFGEALSCPTSRARRGSDCPCRSTQLVSLPASGLSYPSPLDAPSALAACCGFDLCHKYILYLPYSYFYFVFRHDTLNGPSKTSHRSRKYILAPHARVL